MEDGISTKTDAEVERADELRSSAPMDRRTRPLRTIAAVVIGLLAGVGLAVVGSRLLGGDPDPSSASLDAARRTLDQEVDSPGDLLGDAPIPPGAGAESAEAAITGFLDAEVDQDYTTSFGFLSATDRQAFSSAAAWVAGHASVLAPMLSYEQEAIDESGETASVVTSVVFEPGLDQVVGLTPARAEVTWQVAQGPDGSWGVVLDGSTVVPAYPPDSGALAAARAWVEDRQACATPPNERAGLVGSPSLADALCDAAGSIALDDPERLGDSDATPIATAFGPEAAAAARIVRISGPAELGAVLVPVGDEWIVIAVLP